jgi:hypothetical protein
VLIQRKGDKNKKVGGPLPDYTVNSLLDLEELLDLDIK